MAKYSRLRERVLTEGLIPASDLQVSPAAADEQLLRVHRREYLERVCCGRLTAEEIRRIGFPWSPQLVERSRRSVGGTIAAVQAALHEGLGINLAGGTHHARADRGSGFCVFNDVAVAVREVQSAGLADRVLILDCDVHQGDGTALVFAGEPSVFTFSIHGAKNFPFEKTVSTLDVPLADGTGDSAYLEALEKGASQALSFDPDLVIYLAGADPYQGDTFGRLALTKKGLEQRDQWVLERCRGAGLPTAVVMGGGYARRISDIVDIHLATIRTAASMLPAPKGCTASA